MKQVYFLKPVGSDGPIKIGCSRWPAHRLHEVAKWSPIPLEIVAMGAGDHTLERFIHDKFASSRSHKEWFHATADLTARIALVSAGQSVQSAFDADKRMAKHKPKRLGEAFEIAGLRATDLAKRIGVTPQAVLQWKVVPADRVLTVEEITGISRHELRPDIFGPIPTSEARASQ